MPTSNESVDEGYMRRAIELAKIARAKGDTAVGSLIVHNSEIVAEGSEAVKAQMDISAHAEMIAIQQACRALATFDLSGCVLYTTAEPCFMCSYAVRQTRIGKVVFGRFTSHIGGFSSNHPILSETRIAGWSKPPCIVSGVLKQGCEALQS